MSFVAVAIGATAVGSVVGARKQSKAIKSAGAAQERAGQAGIAEQRAAREEFQRRTQPFADIGLGAAPQLLSLLGIDQGPILQNQVDRINDIIQQNTPERGFTTDDFLSDRILGDGMTLGQLLDERARIQRQIKTLPAGGAPSLPGLPSALDVAALPAGGAPLDPSILPAAGTAFDPTSTDNPIMDFLLEEGFRGIRESAAGRGRVPDRDLVRFAQGTAATLVPQLQAQQFGQQQQLRQQAIGEQGIGFGQQQQQRQQAIGEQGIQFGQLGGLRDQARAELQQRVANLQNLLGLGQASAVGQGQAALQTGSNIGNLLGNIGSAQAQTALGQAQNTQNLLGNLLQIGGFALGGRQPQAVAPPPAVRPPNPLIPTQPTVFGA